MNTAAMLYPKNHGGTFNYRQPGSQRQEFHKENDGMRRDGLLITEALAAAHNAPDLRQDRINAVRARIASGEYEIDPLRIANALLRDNPGLFQK